MATAQTCRTGRVRAPAWAALLAATLAAPACGTIRVSPVTDPVRPLRTGIAATGAGSPAARFGSLFCTVLGHNPDGGTWKECATYFSPASAATTLPADFSRNYRVLVVPGIFGKCVDQLAKPFEDGIRHLDASHQFKVELVPVSALGSCAFNAAQIAAHLDQAFSGMDQRPYIVFGYSKGASDIIEMLVRHPTQRPRVAAVVTVAGAVLGSRLTQGVPKHLLDPFKALTIGPCGTDDKGGLDDMRRAPRAESVAKLPDVRTYSIAAVSTEAETSLALLTGWKQLLAFSKEQDSQMIHEDAVVSGGKYLGMAHADHWAVALPFEHVATYYPATPKRLVRLVTALVNHNHYPRAALFEAALRYVLEDLATAN